MLVIGKLTAGTSVVALLLACNASNQPGAEIDVRIGTQASNISEKPFLSLLQDTAVVRVANDSATVLLTIPRTALVKGTHLIGVSVEDEIILSASFNGIPSTAKNGRLSIQTVEPFSGGLFAVTIEASSADEPTLLVSGTLEGQWE